MSACSESSVEDTEPIREALSALIEERTYSNFCCSSFKDWERDSTDSRILAAFISACPFKESKNICVVRITSTTSPDAFLQVEVDSLMELVDLSMACVYCSIVVSTKALRTTFP